jgi:hypothetical protein
VVVFNDGPSRKRTKIKTVRQGERQMTCSYSSQHVLTAQAKAVAAQVHTLKPIQRQKKVVYFRIVSRYAKATQVTSVMPLSSLVRPLGTRLVPIIMGTIDF